MGPAQPEGPSAAGAPGRCVIGLYNLTMNG